MKQSLLLLALAALPMQARQLHLATPHMSLVLQADEGQQARYVYFGNRLSDGMAGLLPAPTGGRMDAYPAYGARDCASEAALSVRHADGNMSTELLVTGSEQQGEVTTIHLADPKYKFTVDLKYKAFADVDMIEAWTEITNGEKGTVELLEFASAVLPIRRGDVHETHLHGAWANEAMVEETRLGPGQLVVRNRDGLRNAQTDHGEVMFSLEGPARELTGDVIGAAICYSGNYRLTTVTDETEYHYFLAGMDNENSSYRLRKGETFQTPPLAFTFSKEGLSGASRNFHRWGRAHRLAHGDTPRMILLNSWEGVYLNVNEEGMDQMMGDIAAMGGELFVMDDGWFGGKYKRTYDNAALGDWVVDTEKLPGGLDTLLSDARRHGVKFGIWLEPEMANTKSELFDNHPSWIIKAPQRDPVMGRGGTQVVLDLSNPEVQDYVFSVFDNLLSKYPEIAYIKWDCNAPLMNHGSQYLSADLQSHLYIEYHRGLESVIKRIRAKFPDIVMQACASGGGRVNWGFLPGFDEFWVSDNTDALQRVYMQWGTSLFFPAMGMASHISAEHNHQTGRILPLKYRIDVAMSGRLGMEIQPRNMKENEREMCRKAIGEYKEIRQTVQTGDIYRLLSPFDDKGAASLMYVSGDKSQAVFFWWKTRVFWNDHLPRVKMAGLDADRLYKVRELNANGNDVVAANGKQFTGQYLMDAGLEISSRGMSSMDGWGSHVLLLE